MALRERLEDYNQSLKKNLEQGDPLDSQFFQGFDQAIYNVVRVLDNILEETKRSSAEEWARSRAESIRGMLENGEDEPQDAWDRGYDAAMDCYLEDLEEFLEMLKGEDQ